MQRGSISIDESFALEVLAEGKCLEVLRTRLSLDDVSGTDSDHQIFVGWRKFWAMKRLLLNSGVSVKQRLKLFDSCVGRSVL